MKKIKSTVPQRFFRRKGYDVIIETQSHCTLIGSTTLFAHMHISV